MAEDSLGRTGGPYLDDLEAKAREAKSARIEGREPDYSKENLFPLGYELVSVVAGAPAEEPALTANEAEEEDSAGSEAPSVPVETEEVSEESVFDE